MVSPSASRIFDVRSQEVIDITIAKNINCLVFLYIESIKIVMKEHIHKHIITELNQNTKTDTIFIITAIFLNLITLAINSGLVYDSRNDSTYLIVMFLFVALIVVINSVVIIGLLKGKETRQKLLDGLINMYKDEHIDKYYDQSLLENYNLRYNLFILVVVFTGVVSILVPFIVR